MSQHTVHCKPGCTTHNGRAMSQRAPGPSRELTMQTCSRCLGEVPWDDEVPVLCDDCAAELWRTHGPALLDELKHLVDLIGHLPENARGTVQGFDVNHAFSRASELLASLEGH